MRQSWFTQVSVRANSFSAARRLARTVTPNFCGYPNGIPIRHIPSIWILVWLQRASARGVTATANTQLF
ncbi:hypothetical protein PPL_01849 [Heterostelium album PN500]|uniref:Uncharacterized protein n=1 Tax=Heterostelium pallidum (strain ATCC 26659 / Pp 5 / PN500) TaxID=670386 RepID=D3B0N2_HETP5|nr:hypothetical protein PPL_01849 [Heterostelium album PN500]EFA84856.1 hypothetical protein PPL_01849 [Heterostelium album PN500]|eukprot:XP_020436967.1 hypothetical protein PPL_01849 [Heterostelium album PN500]